MLNNSAFQLLLLRALLSFLSKNKHGATLTFINDSHYKLGKMFGMCIWKHIMRPRYGVWYIEEMMMCLTYKGIYSICLFCLSLQKGLYIVLSVHSTLYSAWRQARVDWTTADQRTGETFITVIILLQVPRKICCTLILVGINIYIVNIHLFFFFFFWSTVKRKHNSSWNLSHSLLYLQGLLFSAVQAYDISGEERLSTYSPGVLQTDSEVPAHIRLIQ